MVDVIVSAVVVVVSVVVVVAWVVVVVWLVVVDGGAVVVVVVGSVLGGWVTEAPVVDCGAVDVVVGGGRVVVGEWSWLLPVEPWSPVGRLSAVGWSSAWWSVGPGSPSAGRSLSASRWWCV